MDLMRHTQLDTSVEERREGRVIHQGEGDDSFLSAVAAVGGDELDEALDNDEKLAQELQLQEVLMASTKSTKPQIEAGEPLAPSLPCCCEICARPMPSPEVFRAMTCSHALCRACSDRYIEAELQKEDASSVRCPRASCDLVLEPESYRDFVRPEVFCRWLDAHRRGDQKKSIVLMEQRQSVEQRNDPVFHVSIHGEFDRRQLLQLTNTLLGAAAAPGDGAGDPKGKLLIEFPHSTTEIGQSSGAPQVVDEFYCAICMESKPFHEGFGINGCSHKFCMGCVGLYVAAKVGENSTMIGCPDPGCKDGNLEPEMCRSILQREVFDRWGVVLCESALGTEKFYCPYKDCSALVSKEGGDGGEQAMTDAECPHCKRVLCARCGVPWHDGIDCEQYQQLKEEERGREDLMLRQLAKGNRWQRCPKCKFYVEKIEGCTFISCR
ncbi:E3 ubiquitin-protein ligase RNF14 [Cocos nucifera]|uniref:RBR-type E3 ubiquitin transferase n=1 Tax=Cocos nucifera TaxID=13894 RepID=A0A8K0MYF4_COCNU|nr:E3 ubiquitin-protein ligase RNF14 [Cocos nucifera]